MKELMGFISNNELLSIRRQCELLEISRSSVFYKAVGESAENLEIMRFMDEEFIEHPTHGVLQMQDFLSAQGYIVNHKRVRRLLRLMGIMAIFPGRNLSKLIHAEYIRPYLLRGLKITHPKHVWEIDITYIAMAHGFMYLVAIIDVYSRYVVGWDVFNSLDAKNCLLVMKHAVNQHGKPEIINSDQGSQFTSILWTNYIETEISIKISMDGKGRATDNIYIERLWRTVKRDYVYLHPAKDGHELFIGLRMFLEYYNNAKTHQGINRKIPKTLFFQAA